MEESTVNEKGEETIWEFREKDIITTDNKETNWYNEKVIIDVITTLGFYVKELDSSKLHIHNFDPEGIILLERPEYKFKVGDKVEVNKVGYGELIVINPEQELDFVYLVLLDKHSIKEDFLGHDITNWYDTPWFPNKYRDIMKKGKVLWCPDTKLKLLN